MMIGTLLSSVDRERIQEGVDFDGFTSKTSSFSIFMVAFSYSMEKDR